MRSQLASKYVYKFMHPHLGRQGQLDAVSPCCVGTGWYDSLEEQSYKTNPTSKKGHVHGAECSFLSWSSFEVRPLKPTVLR